jgi:hypothetical protein
LFANPTLGPSKEKKPTDRTTTMPLRVTSLSLVSFLLPLLWSDHTAQAFMTPHHHPRVLSPRSSLQQQNAAVSSWSELETKLTNSLKELLEGLKSDDEGGLRLLRASSASWKNAIYKALAAPDTADEKVVAKRLTTAMRKPDQQFAILMMNGSSASNNFVATFPSDPVINDDDGTAWIECRLRDNTVDQKLLVTMGISLVRNGDEWLISALDWQDFRDEFYPGLSGREWLRAF